MNNRIQHIRIYKLSILFFVLVPFFVVQGQSEFEKFEEEITVDTTKSDFFLNINSSYTDVVIKTSNDNVLKVNAHVAHEGLTDEEITTKLNSWDVQVNKENNLITINSISKSIKTASFSIYSSSDQISSLIRKVLAPVTQNIQTHPMPDQLQVHLQKINFDFAAFNQLGDTYVTIWENNFAQDLDVATIVELQKWARSTSNRLREHHHNSFDHKFKQPTPIHLSNEFAHKNLVVTQKVLEVHIPSEMKLTLNVRHGSVNILGSLLNVKGVVKHSPTYINEVNGEQSSLLLAYAPVYIKSYNAGTLVLEYVKEATVEKLSNLELFLNSSDLKTFSMEGGVSIETLFSVFKLSNVSRDFTRLTLLSNNSDVIISLPQVSYNFAYSGVNSLFDLNQQNQLKLNAIENRGNQMLHGYSISRDSNREIQMSMTNSKLLLK